MTRRRERLLDYGAALGLLLAGAVGHYGVRAQVSTAEGATADRAAAAVRAELAPLRDDLGRLATITAVLAARVERHEGAIAELARPATVVTR